MANIESKVARIKNGGGSTPTYAVWQIIGGSNIVPSGVIGVRKVVYTGLIENLELDEVVNLLVPGTLQTGVGVARNFVTQEIKLVYTGISPMNIDIWVNSRIICYGSIDVKITGTGTDPITNPLRTQSFLIPLCLG